MKRKLFFALIIAVVLICGLVAVVILNNNDDGHIHSFGEWKTIVSATCVDNGLEERTCSCDEKETRDIKAKGHDYGNWIDEILATCTENGTLGHYHCSACSKNFDANQNEPLSLVITALGHSMGEWHSNTATCTEAGTERRDCANCDYTTYSEISATGHTEIPHSAKAPTCTDVSWNAYVTCANCDYTTYSEISATGHTEIPHSAKAPTCTDVGWNAYVTCANCDYTTYSEISATGHTEIPHSAKAPTCTDVGWNAYVACANCDYTTYSEIAILDHDYDNRRCTVCGGKQPSEGLSYTLSNNKEYYILSGIGACTDSDIVIPSVHNGLPVKEIGSSFSGYTTISSITIPSSIISIRGTSFKNCYKSSLSISAGRSSYGYVGYYAKAVYTAPYTSKLSNDNGYIIYTDGNEKILVGYTGNETDLVLPSYITQIYKYAFYGCSSLTSIVIGDSVTSIGNYAFYGCSNLTSIVIPDGVTNIGNYAFSDCSRLTSVYYTGTETQWNAIVIGSYNSPLTNATIHYNYTPEE